MLIELTCNADDIRDAMFPYLDVAPVKPTPYGIEHEDHYYWIQLSSHFHHDWIVISIHHQSC